MGAFSGKNPLFSQSCGMCEEIHCQNPVFKAGFGNTTDREGACTIADACPCYYPANEESNKRWCCGESIS